MLFTGQYVNVIDGRPHYGAVQQPIGACLGAGLKTVHKIVEEIITDFSLEASVKTV